jgi:hypothetical protein
MQHDLSALSEELRAAARVDGNGEVSWPDSLAAAAVNGLADGGAMVLGLDVRFYDSDDRFFEIAWSASGPSNSRTDAANVEACRRDALTALKDIDTLSVPEGTVARRILITW